MLNIPVDITASLSLSLFSSATGPGVEPQQAGGGARSEAGSSADLGTDVALAGEQSQGAESVSREVAGLSTATEETADHAAAAAAVTVVVQVESTAGCTCLEQSSIRAASREAACQPSLGPLSPIQVGALCCSGTLEPVSVC